MNSPVRSSVKSRWLCTFTIIGALFLISLILSTSSNTWTSGGIASFARMERDSAEPMEVGNCDLFREKIVHFDLKGAPPKIAYYRELFPFLAKLHVTAVLMEYEDTFPYSQDLSILARPNAYSVEEIHEICKLAQQNNLDLIPLIQTFGHMEFVLQHERYTHLREVPTATDTICPSDSRSQDLIHEMLMQVYRVHSEFMNLTTIHIGADEAWSIAKDERCQQRLSSQLGNNTDRLKLDHISSVALFAKDHLGIPKVLVWNDMFDKINASLMNEYRLGELVVPVVWGYVEDVTREGYFPGGMFDRYSKSFGSFLFGGAFKGANGVDQNFISAKRYLDNLYSYVQLCRNNETEIGNRVSGIILTGWSRYKHDLPLCELLPSGIPTLVAELLFLGGNDYSTDEDTILKKTLRYLDCQQKTPAKPRRYSNHYYEHPVDSLFASCNFPGKEIYAEVEKLRLVAWKVQTFNQKELESDKKEIFDELDQLENSIKPLLLKYFYEDDVNEWIADNLRKYRVFEDKGAMQSE